MPINFTGPNKWQRVYFNQFVGDPNNRKIKAGLIQPFEIPLLFSQHVLAINVYSRDVKPKWRTGGYLTQTYSGVSFEDSPISDSPSSPTYGVDAESKRIGLNTVELLNLSRLANDFYLWFDPVPWMPSLTLSIWEYTGTETPERLEELIETVKVDILRVEYKLDTYSNQ
jgi:hypothetical protein